MKIYSLRQKIQTQDSAMQRFIKQNGSLARYPNEEIVCEDIEKKYKEVEELQRKKCLYANTALYIVTRHLSSLEGDARKLEASGEPRIIGIGSDTDPSDPDALAGLAGSLRQVSLGGESSGTSSRHRSMRRSRSRSRSRRRSRTSSLIRSRSSSRSADDRSSSAEASPVASRHGSKDGTPAVVDVSRTVSESPRTATVSVQKKLQKGGSGSVRIPGGRKNGEDNQLYCFCRQVSYGNMIACDNKDCKYEWFHWGCVGLTAPPKGIWYCPDCRKKMAE